MCVRAWTKCKFLGNIIKTALHYEVFFYAFLSQKDKLSLKIAQISLQKAKFHSKKQIFRARRFPNSPFFPPCVCTYLNVLVILNIVMKFQNVDIYEPFCDIFDLSSARACRVVSVKSK